jgi:hypothetical protein
MPNDAKLGLFTGVIGVIVVAAMSTNRPPAPHPGADTPGSPSAAVKPSEASKAPGPHAVAPAPVARAGEPASTPIPRKRTEPDGTPASRPSRDGDIDP